MPTQRYSWTARSLRGPWQEYALATVIYGVLAVALHVLHRPILFWLCVVFAFASGFGAAYLHRSRIAQF